MLEKMLSQILSQFLTPEMVAELQLFAQRAPEALKFCVNRLDEMHKTQQRIESKLDQLLAEKQAAGLLASISDESKGGQENAG